MNETLKNAIEAYCYQLECIRHLYDEGIYDEKFYNSRIKMNTNDIYNIIKGFFYFGLLDKSTYKSCLDMIEVICTNYSTR